MSQKIKNFANDLAKDTKLREGKGDNDTVRLWENHREQALLWRAVALLQIPVSFIALLAAIVMYLGRDIYLEVPAAPAPGVYKADEIPDAHFINVATNYLNLVATYSPKTAERQFEEAMKFLVEPVLSKFQTDMMGTEMGIIVQTRRSQIFWADPAKTTIERSPDGREVVVTLEGIREKRIADKEAPEIETIFQITMTTIPRNAYNEYGIVIANVTAENKGNGVE